MSIQLADDDHYFFVAKRMLEGKVVPFLGAGANLCGRPEGQPWKQGEYLPSGAELATQLAEHGRYPDPDDRDLMRISQYVDAKLGAGALYEYVRAPFAASDSPTALHRFLASMASLLRERNMSRQVILTTNYDDALEKAFTDQGEPYDLIWYEAKRGKHCGCFIHGRHDGPPVPIVEANDYDDLDPDERTVIVKLHGAMVRRNPASDSYVITEDDYIGYLTRSDIGLQLPPALRQRIAERHLLFLGYSMRDWNLRVVLERLGAGEALAKQSWSVQRQPATEASAKIELTLWGERDVDLVFILLDEYVNKLNEQLGSVAPAP